MIEVGKRHSRLLDVVQGNHARSGGWRRRQIAKGAGGASNDDDFMGEDLDGVNDEPTFEEMD